MLSDCGNAVVREYRLAVTMKLGKCIMNVLVGVNEWCDVLSEYRPARRIARRKESTGGFFFGEAGNAETFIYRYSRDEKC